MVTSPSETAATIKVLDSVFAKLSVLGQHSGAEGVRELSLQLPDDKIEFFIRDGPAASLTSESITDPDRIIEPIAEARKRGWALSHGEVAIGGVGMSVPRHTETPEPASVSLCLPEARAPVDETERLVGLTTTATSIRQAQAYELSAAGVE